MEGALSGTPSFMPPEMALEAGPIDGRADIYAFGCVTYWLLTGHTVFDGPGAIQMVIDHARTPPTPPSRRTAEVIPEALERLIMRCLEKDPAARPQSASELGRELRALGLAEAWTEDRARLWWLQHAPSLLDVGESAEGDTETGELLLATMALDDTTRSTRLAARASVLRGSPAGGLHNG
jgi:serine/threonine-protein kinase